MEEDATPISVAGARLGEHRETQPVSAVEDAGRLRRCLNDLIAIVALPGLWAGAEPLQLLDTLLDALIGRMEALNDSEPGHMTPRNLCP